MSGPKVQIVKVSEGGARSVALVVVPEVGWVAVYDCHTTGGYDLDIEKYLTSIKHVVSSPTSMNMTLEKFASELLAGHVMKRTDSSRCEVHPANVPARDCPASCYQGGHVVIHGVRIDLRPPGVFPERRRANDTQVGGTHYVRHGEFQPWDAWWLWKLNAFQGVVIKYVVRYRDKGGVEDLRKAVHYLEKLIECEEEAARAVPEGEAGHGGVHEGRGPK